MITVSPHATDQDKYIIWLKQAESFCSAAGLDYIDVLVDQAGTDQPLQNEMLHLWPAIHWYALFEGTPEAETMEYSPVVLRLYFALSSHRKFLAQLMASFADTPRLTLLISPSTCWGGIFRYCHRFSGKNRPDCCVTMIIGCSLYCSHMF